VIAAKTAVALQFARTQRFERRVLWILGPGRSGSTWLLNLLRALPGVVGINEPLIGAHLGLRQSAVTGLTYERDPRVLDSEGDRDDYFFARSAQPVWERDLRRLLLRRLAVAAVHGTRVRESLPRTLAIKEPNGSSGASVLLGALPASRLLFLVRDGRDVVDSALDGVSGGWITESSGYRVEDAAERRAFLEDRARLWVDRMDLMHRAFDDHDPALRLLVPYERLRSDTAGELARIAEWARIEATAVAIGQASEALAFEAIPRDVRGPGRFARAATPGLWRERFTEEEAALVNRIMGPALTRAGYAPD
jgi:hypothetical protein